MKVDMHKDGDTLTVRIHGEINVETTPELQETVEGSLEDVKEVYFDLADVEHVSSSGLRVFLSVYHRLNEKNGHMVLKNVTDNVMDVLRITKFSDFMEIKN